MKWIDKIPLLMLVIIAALLAVVPMHAESHLLEKSKMLLSMTLVKPIDIFDFVMHATPSMLLLIRLSRMALKKMSSSRD